MSLRFYQVVAAISVFLWPLSSGAYDLARQVKTFELSNGMRWLFVRRTQAPVVSGCVMVRVGGVDEEPGKTGLAHMFEHMAFKGTSRLGTQDFSKEKPILGEIEKAGEEQTALELNPNADRGKIRGLKERMAELQKEVDRLQIRNEIWEVMSRNGARDLNAYTSKDVTAYYASVPADRFELWASVTAEMIFDPVYREFYTERSVVAEERRTSVENDPDGAMTEKLLLEAYIEGPHRWSTVGYERDVLGLTIADARRFHKRYYVPANMVGVLVGDISLHKARRIIEMHFGRQHAEHQRVSVDKDVKPKGGVRSRLNFDAGPSLIIAYHKPTLPNPVEYTFDVIQGVLCEGRSSRLHRRLIYKKKMAKDIYCSDGYPGSRLSNLFIIWVEPIRPYRPAHLLKEVLAEVSRLGSRPLDYEELHRVRNQVTSELVFSLDENMGLAQMLATYETIFSNWRILADYPKMVEKVDLESVMEVAKRYLVPENRVVVERLRSDK